MFKILTILALLCAIARSEERFYGGGNYYGYYLQPVPVNSQLSNSIMALLNRLPLTFYNNYICNVLVGASYSYQNPWYSGYPYAYYYNRRNKRETYSAYQLLKYSHAVRGSVKVLYPYWDRKDIKGLYDEARKIGTAIMAKGKSGSLTTAEISRKLLKNSMKTPRVLFNIEDVLEAMKQLNEHKPEVLRAATDDRVRNSCTAIGSAFYCNYLTKLKTTAICSSIYYSSAMLSQCCNVASISTTTSSTATTTSSTTATTSSSSATTSSSTATTTATTRVCGTSTVNPATRFSKFVSTMDELRIVGGVATEKCEYPWVVRIRSGQNLCSGSIIDNTHILTAAHCFPSNILPSDVTVYAGDHNYNIVDDGEVQKAVSTITLHPGFTQTAGDTVDNDIAIVTLSTPLTFSSCIQPICLPSAGASSKLNNTQCTVAGWGTTSYGGPPSPILQEVTIPTYNGAECSNVFTDSLPTNTNTQICAGQTGTDSCQGDSGGPLFCPEGGSYVQYGIVSYGDQCAVAGKAGVYTDVSAMTDFINNILSASRFMNLHKTSLPFFLAKRYP